MSGHRTSDPSRLPFCSKIPQKSPPDSDNRSLDPASRQRRHESKQKAADEAQTYKAWLTGLRAELNHIRKVIDEITPIVAGVHVSTKRINSDFLKEARLIIFKHDEDTEFLEELTTAFRDIVHTNGMLDRLEEETAASRQNIRPNVIDSMRGVSASVSVLSASVDRKLRELRQS